MTQNLDVQELSLVIAVERQDPSLLTPDFLRYSGIIPQDWEVSRQPVRAQQAARTDRHSIHCAAQTATHLSSLV